MYLFKARNSSHYMDGPQIKYHMYLLFYYSYLINRGDPLISWIVE
jgi:hypothetical protein